MTTGGSQDYYTVLGVGRDAGAEEIQRAFRTLARQYHPDVNKDPGAEERFKQVNEAYRVLSDPATRRRYDRFGPDFRQIPEGYEDYVGAAAGRPGQRDGAGRGGGVRVDTGGFRDFGGVDFDDLFGGLFGARGSGPVAGADQEAGLELSVEEAYRGGRRHLTLTAPDGQTTSYEVTIPPGVTEGQRIRLAGQGGHGSRTGARGDLYLVVRIVPHPRYRLDGRDINTDLLLTPWEAALGTTVPVATPGGEAKVKVPAGSSTGRRLRLRGEGMPNPRGTPGDLYAVVKIMVPPRLTPRDRDLFEALARESDFNPRGA